MDANTRAHRRNKFTALTRLYNALKSGQQYFEKISDRYLVTRQENGNIAYLLREGRHAYLALFDPISKCGEAALLYDRDRERFERDCQHFESELARVSDGRCTLDDSQVRQAIAEAQTIYDGLPVESKRVAELWVDVPEEEKKYFRPSRYEPHAYPEKRFCLMTRADWYNADHPRYRDVTDAELRNMYAMNYVYELMEKLRE